MSLKPSTLYRKTPRHFLRLLSARPLLRHAFGLGLSLGAWWILARLLGFFLFIPLFLFLLFIVRFGALSLWLRFLHSLGDILLEVPGARGSPESTACTFQMEHFGKPENPS